MTDHTPKPVTPHSVRDLIAAVLHDMLGREAPHRRWTHSELADAVAERALPAHERMIREQVAAELAALRELLNDAVGDMHLMGMHEEAREYQRTAAAIGKARTGGGAS